MKKLLLILLCFPMIGFGQDDTENAAGVVFITGNIKIDSKGIYLESSDCAYSGNYYFAGSLDENTGDKKNDKANKKANKKVAKRVSIFSKKVKKAENKVLENREVKCIINEETNTISPLRVIGPMFEPVVTGISPLCELALIGIYALYLETERIKTLTRVVTYKMEESDDGDVEQMLFYDKNCNAIGMDQLARMTPEIKQVLKEANIAVLANIAAVGIILANIKALKQEIANADLIGKIAGAASLVEAGIFQVRLLNDNKRLRDRIKECKGIMEMFDNLNSKEQLLISSSDLEADIKEFVEKKVNEWQKKGEFEKTNDYLVRVNEKNRTVKIKELQESAIYNLKRDFLNSIDFSNIVLGDYDADNETFLLKDKKLGNLVISVPINEAQEFKNSFYSHHFGVPYIIVKFLNPECIIIDDRFVLSYVEVTKQGGRRMKTNNINGKYTTETKDVKSKTYTYNLSNTEDYTITDIEYEFLSIEIDDITSAKKTKSSNISTNKLKVGTSSVNINIPTNKKVRNRYALVIGNEDYTSYQRTLSSEQNVDYAVNDAKVFKEYALKTLGVKEDNMFFLTDATAVEMNREITRVSKIIKKIGNKAELIVYYAGHGLPDENTKVPYLIPVDVSANDLSYAVKLDDFYKDLASTGAKRITIFLDACFTGGGRVSGLLASRGVKVKPKERVLDGNLVVFSASSEEQSALPYHKEGHGMFTYHLLKKIQESKGKVSMGELADYIKGQVSIQSLKTNIKEQDPVINISSKVQNSWRDWEF